MILEKQMYYFLAIKEILELFAEQELGSRCEINIKATIDYIESFSFQNDSWGLKTKDEIYQLVTDDILAGYPIWQLLEIPEWTKNMLERDLEAYRKAERERLEKTYKCYTCKWFIEYNTSLGSIHECKRPKEENKRIFKLKRDCGDDIPKKRCKFYITKEK